MAEPGPQVSSSPSPGTAGAGKSSLLWAIAGAVPLAEGRVRIGDEEVRDRDAGAARDVEVIPQGSAPGDLLSAHENIALALLAAGVEAADAGARARVALASVGLEESGSHLVEELSGGQQQRVAVARGLALRRPGCCSPTSRPPSSTTTTASACWPCCGPRPSGAPIVVMATHDPEAAAQADGEIRLDDGQLETGARGPAASLLRVPKPIRLPFDPITRAAQLWTQRWGRTSQPLAMASATSIMRVQQLLITDFDAMVGRHGLTFARYEALVLLAFSRDGRLGMSKIGQRLMVHPTSATNIVQRLDAQGFVERGPEPRRRPRHAGRHHRRRAATPWRPRPPTWCRRGSASACSRAAEHEQLFDAAAQGARRRRRLRRLTSGIPRSA